MIVWDHGLFFLWLELWMGSRRKGNYLVYTWDEHLFGVRWVEDRSRVMFGFVRGGTWVCAWLDSIGSVREPEWVLTTPLGYIPCQWVDEAAKMTNNSLLIIFSIFNNTVLETWLALPNQSLPYFALLCHEARRGNETLCFRERNPLCNIYDFRACHLCQWAAHSF